MKVRQTLQKFGVVLTACVVVGLAAPSAWAAFTTVRAPDPFNETPEDNHERILENVYGGNFTKNGVDYTNGSVTAARIDDSMDNNNILGLVDGDPGEASDRVWHDGFTDAFAKVRFARDSQSFGYFEGTSGGSFQKLFDVSGQGYAVSGGTMLADLKGKTFRWGRDRGRGGTHSSRPDENPDDLDHMVSYKINGLQNTRGYTVWLLFWEDLNFNPEPNALTSDRDINDLAIELRAIPEPTTAGLMLAGLGVVHCATRRRRRI